MARTVPPLWLALSLAACAHPAPPTVVVPSAIPVQSAAPVSFEMLDAEVSALLPGAKDADQRDRLQAIRSLIETMRGQDPRAQHAVYDYLAATLTIEERTQPEVILGDGLPLNVPITEEAVESSPPPGETAAPSPTTDPAPSKVAPTPADPGTANVAQPPPSSSAPPPVPPGLPTTAITTSSPALPPPPDALRAAQDALAQARYTEALDLLDKIDPTDPAARDVARVRKEAVDGWAKAERERAGAAFLTAKAMPEGPERTAALRTVRDDLSAVNARFPDNTYAAQIRENLQRVETELARSAPRSESP